MNTPNNLNSVVFKYHSFMLYNEKNISELNVYNNYYEKKTVLKA